MTLLFLASLAAPRQWLCPNDDDGGFLIAFPRGQHAQVTQGLSLTFSHACDGHSQDVLLDYLYAYAKDEFIGLLCTALMSLATNDGCVEL